MPVDPAAPSENRPIHIPPQGVSHSIMPEMGSGNGGRPMLIAKTDPMQPPLSSFGWPTREPNPNPSAGMDPASFYEPPMGVQVWIPGPIMKRFS